MDGPAFCYPPNDFRRERFVACSPIHPAISSSVKFMVGNLKRPKVIIVTFGKFQPSVDRADNWNGTSPSQPAARATFVHGARRQYVAGQRLAPGLRGELFTIAQIGATIHFRESSYP